MGRLRWRMMLWVIGLGLLAALPGPAGAAGSGPAPTPARPQQVAEDLRQLDALLGVPPETLRHQGPAALENHLRRLFLVRERLGQSGALEPTLQEYDRRIRVQAGLITALLPQHRAASSSSPPAASQEPLAVLESFAVGLAGSPVLLGAIVGTILLLLLGGMGLGQRRAWVHQPAAHPTPALVRAVAALQAAQPQMALDVRRARQAVAGGRPLLLSLSYEIKPERRGEYMAYMERLRDHLVREVGYAYAVWEQDGKPNWFTEMILCTTAKEFDRLAGPDDSTTRRFLRELDQYLVEPSRVQRTTLMGMALAPAAARAAGEAVVRQPDAVLEPDARSVPIPSPAREVPPGDLAAEAA